MLLATIQHQQLLFKQWMGDENTVTHNCDHILRWFLQRDGTIYQLFLHMCKWLTGLQLIINCSLFMGATGNRTGTTTVLKSWSSYCHSSWAFSHMSFLSSAIRVCSVVMDPDLELEEWCQQIPNFICVLWLISFLRHQSVCIYFFFFTLIQMCRTLTSTLSIKHFTYFTVITYFLSQVVHLHIKAQSEKWNNLWVNSRETLLWDVKKNPSS